MFGFLSMLVNTGKYNDDPDQKTLAGMIQDAALHKVSFGRHGKRLDPRKIFHHASESGWSNKEAANRFVLAASMIKPMADKLVYDEAVVISKDLYQACLKYRPIRQS